MRLPAIKIAIASAVALAVALAVGLLHPGLTAETLQRHAEDRIARCMRDAGVAGAGARVPAAAQPAFELCWSATANDDRYERLGLLDPVARNAELRVKGAEAWRCVERAGYVRTTPIPLSGPKGYPLRVAAGNFRVGSSDAALERFYRTAADCSGEPLASFRWADGSFSSQSADGTGGTDR